MTKEYKPIGVAPAPIKGIRATSDWITAQELLEKAKIDHPLAYITSHISENGHTNRDWEYSCTRTTEYTIVEDQPYYSQADNLEMMRESLAETLANSKIFPVEGDRAARIVEFRKRMGVRE